MALDGTVRPIRGALSMALAARDEGKKGLLVPVANAQEAGVVEGLDVFAVGEHHRDELRCRYDHVGHA